MSATAPIQSDLSTPKAIHLICTAQVHENAEAVTATIKELAHELNFAGPFIQHFRCPKPRAIEPQALILTDHPSRVARSPQELLALVIGFLKREAEVLIPGYFHIKHGSEVAAAFLALDDARKAMRSARIREGLYLAKQRGVKIGRKKIESAAAFHTAKKEYGSYRVTANKLTSAGHTIGKSTLHALLRSGGDESE